MNEADTVVFTSSTEDNRFHKTAELDRWWFRKALQNYVKTETSVTRLRVTNRFDSLKLTSVLNMFNAPRQSQNRYPTGGGLSGSVIDYNPLSSSTYDGYDPWSGSTSPAPEPQSSFTSVIGSLVWL